MIEIIQDIAGMGYSQTILKQSVIQKATQKAINAIIIELPEEDRTIEVMEYIISEISREIKEKQIL